MRVVFDTNILVSAFVLPGGSGDEALRRVLEGHDELVISKPIIDELLLVLARKFSRDPDELSRLALFLSDSAELVRPRRRLQVLEDDPDNRILECALTGQAEAIVTGDKQMLALREYRGVRLISLRNFLQC